MREIRLTKGFAALVDDADYDFLSQWRWYAAVLRDGVVYAARRLSVKEARTAGGQGKMIYMHQLISGYLADHIDRNGLNNQRSNLRVATRSQQNHNRRKNRNGITSVHKGVHYNRLNNNWRMRFYFDGKQVAQGSFSTEAAAAAAYNEAALLHAGEFAQLNTL